MGEIVKKVLENVQEEVPAYVAEAMDLLRSFSSIDCGTGDIEGNARVVELVEKLLYRINGIRVERHFFDGYGFNLEARLNPGHPNGKIVLCGHLDTVFKRGDTAAHPFRIQGDLAYGLGIADCKGGIVVAVLSVLLMQKMGMLPDKEILFLLGCDEETLSPVSTEFYKKMADGAAMAFVFEPARGEDGILTSRKGSLKYRIECSGKAAHAGNNYEEGASAVIELAHKLVQLYEKNDHVRRIQFNPAVLEDGHGQGRTNIVSDHASAMVGVRISDEEDLAYVEAVMKHLEETSCVTGCTTQVTRTFMRPPMIATEENRKLYRLVAEAGREAGMELPEQTSGGWGDASTFSCMGIPTVDALGPYMYRIHSVEEHMRVSSVADKIRLFCAVLGKIKEEM